VLNENESSKICGLRLTQIYVRLAMGFPTVLLQLGVVKHIK
jgi:hypothetical protein